MELILRLLRPFSLIFAVLIAVFVIWGPQAQAADPIKIGFSASLSGALASSGKANLLAQQIWAEEINAKGGLLGRPVQLVFYDDQTNASIIPGIYAKMIDIDKVDLLMGAATNLIVAAMPLIMQRHKMVMVLVALGSNDEFKYRDDRRAGDREERRIQHRLRSHLPPCHCRLYADRALDPGNQSGPRLCCVIPARLGRHGAGFQGSRVE